MSCVCVKADFHNPKVFSATSHIALLLDRIRFFKLFDYRSTKSVLCQFYKLSHCHTAILDVDIVLSCELLATELTASSQYVVPLIQLCVAHAFIHIRIAVLELLDTLLYRLISQCLFFCIAPCFFQRLAVCKIVTRACDVARRKCEV